ncbi:hypothetical protein M407DRAFT_25969 [Tulasnella calospora MUT 4182]|uniref:Uncharacterized protein n=1 Tax=Tulasnella calospora MUT 4182 TaxID=1051891 RepID=A0A0C3Q5Z2_9AGAM|nr:hypothetical protein M407DRAFT_25969 [Tulasnella calospora MUT 4182]
MADLTLSDDIVFDGSGGADKFIRGVRKAAFQAGKHNDDAWCAGFASTCLEGPAFLFYEKLGEDVQNSWKLLRSKLVEQFPITKSGSQS